MSKPKVVDLPIENQDETKKPSVPKDSREPKTLGENILTPAFFFSLLTATAYLTGVAFQEANLSTLKIPYGLFPKSSPDYFILAFRAVIELFPSEFSSPLKNIGAAIAIVAGLFMISAINIFGEFLGKSARMKDFQERARTNKLLNFIGKLLFAPAIGLMVLFYVPTAFIILMTIPVVVGLSGGAKAAQSEIASYEGGCAKPKGKGVHCTQIIEGTTPVATGFIIDMSDKYVAIYVDGEAKAIPIKDRDFLPYTPPTSKP